MTKKRKTPKWLNAAPRLPKPEPPQKEAERPHVETILDSDGSPITTSSFEDAEPEEAQVIVATLVCRHCTNSMGPVPLNGRTSHYCWYCKRPWWGFVNIYDENDEWYRDQWLPSAEATYRELPKGGDKDDPIGLAKMKGMGIEVPA